MTDLYDVLEVEIATGKVLRVMGEPHSKRNAEAWAEVAVMRRGVEHSFYPVVPHGSYQEGEEYRGAEAVLP